jgi:Mu-like prophage protein gp16
MTDRRLKLIKIIHVARRELGMDEDSYRQMLANMPETRGKTSTADLTEGQLEAVVKTLKSKGFKVKPKPKSRRLADDRQSRLIRSLWLQLHEAGAVRDASESALASYIHKRTGVEAMQWVASDQASMIIETLKKWLKRVEKQHG